MFEIRRFDAPLGAEVLGIDLAKPIDDDTFNHIVDAFAEHSVLVFPNQDLTVEEHIGFTRRFGELEILGFYEQYLYPGHPEIFVVSNIVENGKSIGLPEAGRVWHTDVSYKSEPSMGSLLYAREVPFDADGNPLGDTLFASTAVAFDHLPDSTKERLAGRKGVHRLDETRYNRDTRTDRQRGSRAALTEAQKKMIKEVIHPIVRTHPVSGRKSLYVNELYTFRIEGEDDEQGRRLIEELCTHITQPKFIYRHKWSVGDLLMWDNCATQHNAIGDYALPQRRLMHRTTVKGSAPF